MINRSSSALVVALSIVLAAIILRPALVPEVAAQVAFPRVLTFQAQLADGVATTVGTIPAGRKFSIRDVVSGPVANHCWMDLQVDGTLRCTVTGRDAGGGLGGLSTHFAAGIVVNGGEALPLRLVGGSPLVTVSGFIE